MKISYNLRWNAETGTAYRQTFRITEEENKNLSLSEKEHIELYLNQGYDKKEALRKVAKERGVSKSSLR